MKQITAAKLAEQLRQSFSFLRDFDTVHGETHLPSLRGVLDTAAKQLSRGTPTTDDDARVLKDQVRALEKATARHFMYKFCKTPGKTFLLDEHGILNMPVPGGLIRVAPSQDPKKTSLVLERGGYGLEIHTNDPNTMSKSHVRVSRIGLKGKGPRSVGHSQIAGLTPQLVVGCGLKRGAPNVLTATV